jgi:hypothetical protein
VQVDIQEAIREKWIVGLSSGLQWDGYSTLPSFTFNASTSYPLTNIWTVTAECFGFINHEAPKNSLDVRLDYVINDLIQFGVTAGRGMSSAAPKSYFAVTGSWGFNTSSKQVRH